MNETIRILLADDHPLFREGLAYTLARESDFEIVGEADSGATAVEMARSLGPDVALLDVTMDGEGDGLEAARHIAAACPATRIMMLTVSEDEDDVTAALRVGACGYVLKGVSGRELTGIVRRIAGGQTYVAPGIAAGLLRQSLQPKPRNPLDDLTRRERQIVELLAEGLSNREIGERLFLSEKTVKHHMTHVLNKLQVKSRLEVALLVAGARRETRH